eukprot:scaffold48734_cov72-Phaeocystis_antarctica.AAC.8
MRTVRAGRGLWPLRARTVRICDPSAYIYYGIHTRARPLRPGPLRLLLETLQELVGARLANFFDTPKTRARPWALLVLQQEPHMPVYRPDGRRRHLDADLEGLLVAVGAEAVGQVVQCELARHAVDAQHQRRVGVIVVRHLHAAAVVETGVDQLQRERQVVKPAQWRRRGQRRPGEGAQSSSGCGGGAAAADLEEASAEVAEGEADARDVVKARDGARYGRHDGVVLHLPPRLARDGVGLAFGDEHAAAHLARPPLHGLDARLPAGAARRGGARGAALACAALAVVLDQRDLDLAKERHGDDDVAVGHRIAWMVNRREIGAVGQATLGRHHRHPASERRGLSPRASAVQAEATPGPLRGCSLQLTQRARASLGQERHRHDRALHVAEHEGSFLCTAQQRVAVEARVHEHATKLSIDLEDA